MTAAAANPGRMNAFKGRARALVVGLLVLVAWTLAALLMMPLICLALLLRSQPRRRELGQMVLHRVFRAVIRVLEMLGVITVAYEGFEPLLAHAGAVILAPNHPALWDAVLILGKVDRAACVLKASLMRNPLLVLGARAADYIPHEPTHQMLRRCIELLRGGERILFFPEGTRTCMMAGCVNPLTGGLVLLARNSGAPVWPIYIQTSSGYLSKGWPIWRLPSETIHVRIRAGVPRICRPEEDAAEFLETLRATYVAAGCGQVAAGAGFQSRS